MSFIKRLLAEVQRRFATTVVSPRGGPPTDPPPGPTREGGAASLGTPLGPDRSYYACARPELLERVPRSARRILDLGCGAGRLGEALKARQPAEVVGIEMDPEAATAARGRLDRVLCGDFETVEPDFGEGAFDAVVCGDVLEHLRDPAAALRKIRGWLAPGGRLVASIPNVRHHSVVRGLLDGNWTYEPAGLLDRTHLHFFTRRSIEETFGRCGLVVDGIDVVLGPGDEEAARLARTGAVRVGRFHLEGLSPADAEEFFAYQYLVAARPAAPRAEPATVAGATLGCVLAILDRPADCLERTLQTYAYQTVQPADKVLLDYGSAVAAAAAYRELCHRYGWRYVAAPAESGWYLSDAYNRAVAALNPAIEVVFKNDVDVLLGEDVLAVAAERGRDRLCLFSRLTTAEGTRYPDRFAGPDDLAALLEADPAPGPVDSEGIQAFPRRWFEEIGGFDLAYQGWGYDDSDLRLRAEWSIGVVWVTAPLLLHQWHPAGPADPRTARNRAYYERTKAARQVVRNRGGAPAPSPDTLPAACRPALRLPRVFHQVWVGPNPLPAAAAAYTESWKRLHPGWEVRLWTDANLPPLRHARLYEQTTILAQKADLLRYELLERFGGVYIDVDFECLRNLEPLLDGVEYVYADQRPGEPNIALLGRTPGHAFAHWCVERLPERWPWRTGQILEETGPGFFRRAVLDYVGAARLHPLTDPRSGRVAGNRLEPRTRPPLWAWHPWVVYPYYAGAAWQPALHPDAYAVHHWQKNWE